MVHVTTKTADSTHVVKPTVTKMIEDKTTEEEEAETETEEIETNLVLMMKNTTEEETTETEEITEITEKEDQEKNKCVSK